MKNFALTAVCALVIGVATPAGAIEVFINHGVVAGAPSQRTPDFAAAPGSLLLPTTQLSELPEPEVFAMMLLGLVLIGYRSSRHSDEKFK